MALTTTWLVCAAAGLLHCSISSSLPREPIAVGTDTFLETNCGFNCTSGECLEEEKVCDGKADCSDKSDETTTVCLNRTYHCPGYAYLCEYGACVDADAHCNGVVDCADASDERNCEVADNTTCSFQCKSGECLDAHKMCDGVVDCPDRSDETQDACSTGNNCPSYAVRCDYGACVDSDSRCNGRVDCADGSDEKGCPMETQKCRDGKFQCDDGTCIDGTDLCDGNWDCKDGSDETRKQCELFMCPGYAFRCDYGACIDGDEACDGKQHCADGSDESPSVCSITTPKHIPCPQLNPPQHSEMMILGSVAQFSCKQGYSLSGPDTILCHKGVWASSPPSCTIDDNSIPSEGSNSSTLAWNKILVLLSVSVFTQWA